METKTCSDCEKAKPVSEFYRHHSKGYQNTCKICKAAYNKSHYLRNKEKYRDSAKAYKKKYRDWYNSLKDGPCTDCGEKFHHAAMHFDHLEDKSFGLAIGKAKLTPKKEMLKEISKCELVCANCHSVRTWNRTQQ